jgi:hypothetical protein
MFHDLDITLRTILNDVEAPSQLRNTDVSFETPEQNYRPGQATVNLFLHEVRENRDLRDPEPFFDLVNGEYVRRLPPLRVDCSYLVTTWSNETAGVKVAEEHQLLGEALGWLSRFSIIPNRYLQGTLVGQPYPPPTLVAQMDGTSSLGEFWNALGIAPRPAFTLVVTIALELGVEHPVGPEVITHRIDLGGHNGGGQETHYAIGGTVRTSGSGEIIEGATVTIQELGYSAQTNAAGQFYFSGLAAEAYTLHVNAEGFGDMDVAVQVPGTAPHAYDIHLIAVS